MPAVRAQVASVVAEINRVMSPYLDQSELSCFQPHRYGGLAESVRAPLAKVAADALRDIPVCPGGAFDPTIGPLVNRFGFGPIQRSAGAARKMCRFQGEADCETSPPA
jgi:thiamine biosynthesis lipoprotein